MTWRGISTTWAGPLVLALLFTCHPAVAVDATGEIVDVHAIRAELWSTHPPRTPQDLVELKRLAVERELTSRKQVLDDLAAHMRGRQLRPPVSSGTPPHLAGGSGALTDVDMTFATFEDAQEAAAYLRGKGYTVEWNTADTFSVRELDYTGFAKTRPRMAPGTPEEVRFLREASRFPDKLWTKGSQQWVEGATLESSIGELKQYQATLEGRLEQQGLTARQIQATEIKLERVQRRLATLTERLQAVQVTDRTGFTADMMKKAIHHVDRAKWGPMFEKFGHYEDPRQAAKAGARALKELAQRTEEQAARLQYLDDIAKGRAVLPGTGAELAAAEERLAAMVNQSMHEAWEAAMTADAALDQALVAEYEAAAASGDAAAISRARVQLAERQLAARRLEAVLEGLVEVEGAEASQALHEWLTGERLRLVETPGQAPVYEVVEETADGLRVVGRRTAAEVRESGLKALEEAALRKAGQWSHSLGGYEPPSFASVSTEGMTVAGKAKAVASSPLTLLLAGYAAWVGADQATQAMDEHWDVLELSDLGDWDNLTAEKLGGWARATFLGTVLGIGEITGISHVVRSAAAQDDFVSGVGAGAYAACQVLIVCTLYEMGNWYSEEAIRIEVEAAQREGRPVSRARIFANLANAVPTQELGKRLGESMARWGTQRAEEIREALAAELEAIRNWYASSEIGAELEAALGSGGLGKLASILGGLRLQTAAIQEAWSGGTHELDQAIFWNQEMERLLELLEPPPDFEEECRVAVEQYTDTRPTEADLARLRAGWEQELEERRELIEVVRKAAVETVSRGLNAAFALNDPGVWALTFPEQQERQRELAGRFARLALALPDHTQIASWRAEIDSAATPVPIEQRPDLVREARGLVLAADAVLRRLDELAAQQTPECSLPSLVPAGTAVIGTGDGEEERQGEGGTQGPPGGVGATAAPAGAEASEPLVLVLAAVEIPSFNDSFEIRHPPESTGFTLVRRDDHRLDYYCAEGVTWGGCPGSERWWRDYPTWRELTASLKIDAPPRIVLGQPFSFTADLKIRDARSRAHSDCHAEGDRPENKVFLLEVSSGDLKARAETPENATHVHCDWMAVCDQRGINAGDGRVYGAPCRTGAREKDATISFDAFFVPVEVEVLESGARRYDYALDHSAQVTRRGEDRATVFTETWNDDGSYSAGAQLTVGFSMGSDRNVRPTNGALLLRYRPQSDGEPSPVVPYEHPAELLRPPVEEPWSGDEGEVAETTEGGGQPGDTGVAVPGAAASGDASPPGGAGGRGIDPRQPETAALIREWIAIAEPPENAVPGVHFRYDEYGRKIGGGGSTGRTVGAQETVGYDTGGPPEVVVWSELRSKLDSIDHCTLEEYVLARSEERPIDHCRGRYGAMRDLAGVPLAEAQAEARGAGFEVVVALGSPAGSPAAEGTVETQRPAHTHYLRRGQRLELQVHGRHAPATTPAPGLVGLTLPEAQQRLTDGGFDVVPVLVGPAPSSEQSGRVAAQRPRAGAPIAAGSTVELDVYSDPAPPPVPPTLPPVEPPAPAAGTSGTASATVRDGRPDVRCPSHPQGKQLAPAESGFTYESESYDIFQCKYVSQTEHPSTVTFHWTHNASTARDWCDNEQHVYDFYAHFYGPTRATAVYVYWRNPVDREFLLDLTRSLERAFEPYTLPCSATGGTGATGDPGPATASPMWVRTGLRVNPANEPTEFIVGVTPYFYSERNAGSFRRWSVSQDSMTFSSRWLDHGNLEMDVAIGVNFSSPPDRLIPGRTVQFSASFFHRGVVHAGNPAIAFEYRVDGVSLSGTPGFTYAPFAPNAQSGPVITSSFVVPAARSGGEMRVTAFLWNCGACNVTWIYQAR